jgi:hypothetical protein
MVLTEGHRLAHRSGDENPCARPSRLPMADPRSWCRIRILGPGGLELGTSVLEGPGDPDLAAVDRIARLALLARRDGGTLVLAEVCPELAELLELAGLGVEVER